MKKIWFTVHGTWIPTLPTFDTEEEAIAYAQEHTNDWATLVTVTKTEVIWVSDDKCTACHGAGYTALGRLYNQPCNTCKGTGKI